MKKILRYTMLLVAAVLVAASAHSMVIKYKLADGTIHGITSSELSAVDFNDDGTITLTAYDGQVIETTDVEFDELEVGTREMLLPGEWDEDMTFEYEGFSVGTRPVRQFCFLYPTVDPQGDSITMSARIIIPINIMEGDPSEGVLLFNHYTIFNRKEAPTQDYNTIESVFLANPFNPNYIIIESDFYGFGATVRFPQAYLQGVANAHASLDCLLAGKRLLEEMGIDCGPLTFNVGYSSGGFDALATQKLRDMEFSDRISFDKTFSGGSPSDILECYRQYIELDSTAYNAVLALLMVSLNETQHLGLNYDDVFTPYIASRIDEWVNSKNYSSWPVCDSIGREKKVHEILTAPYCDLESPESKVVQALFEQNSLATGWIPDPSQRMYIFHSRGDDYVPVQSARPLLRHLEQYGFEPSIIPGKTHLQTNFVVPNLGHLSATLVYLAQSIAAIKAWPMMYTDGELNEPLATLLSGDLDVIATMRALDAAGFDCRAVITSIVEQIEGATGQDMDMDMIIAAVLARLEELGLDTQAMLEMSQDSGLDIRQFIIDLVAYLSEGGDNGQGAPLRAARMMKSISEPLTPADEYAKQMLQWFDENGVKEIR